jgi:glutamate racemase
MEPAVKPAAETTKTGRVGVLATPATFQGALYASVVERFAAGVELFQHTCPGLVEQIENGELDSAKTRAILEDALHPMLEKNIDTIVLGCTHYPFVIPLIERIVGEKVRVIDPAPSVAKQAKRLLEAAGMRNQSQEQATVRFFTSGEPSAMKSMLPVLLRESGDVASVTWINDREVFAGLA